MTEPVETTPEAAAATKMLLFRHCNCNGKPHGYFVKDEKRFPATVVSRRAANFVLKGLLETEFLSPEQEEPARTLIAGLDLPEEVDGDEEVAAMSFMRSQSPVSLESLLSQLSESLGGNVRVVRL